MDVAWPGYGFVKKDKGSGGVILHHHSKLVVEEIKTRPTELSVLWVLVKDQKTVQGENGTRLDRLTVVGCMAMEEGDRGVVEYLDREVGKMREQFGVLADIVLIGNIG